MVSNMRTRLGGGSRSTRNEVLAEAYFRWLIHKVRTDGRSRYHDLLWIMDNTEFIWIVPNDDNRLMDGLELRKEFFREQKIRGKPLARPCSILEVVVGLSRRLEWLEPGTAEEWAWILLRHLDLHKFRDPLSPRKETKVEDILYTLIWRTYDPNGTGGFFPLIHPEKDQRQVEIWYQMHAYVREIHSEY